LLQIWRAVVESHSPTEWVVHNQGYDADIEPGADYQVDFVARAAGDQAGTVTYFIEGKPERYSYICTIRNTLAIITFPSSPGIVVIRNSVLNGKTQLIEGDKQRWPISFYWKSHTVTLTRRRINILLVELTYITVNLCLSLSLSWVFPSIASSE